MAQGGFFLASDAELSDLRALKKRFSKKYLGASDVVAAQGARQPVRFAASAMAAPSPTAARDGNVVGVGIGEKLSDEGPTGVKAITFLVKVKYPKSQLTEKTLIPPSVDGIPTDVVEVGILRPFARKKSTASARPAPAPAAEPNPQTRIRPAAPGCSIGFREPSDAFIMAGTFGALVRDDQAIYILSNNHVLADENALDIGSPIFQPGLLDGGSVSRDQVAALSRFIPLDPSGDNAVDCAIAKVTRAELVTNAILHIGAPTGVADAEFDMNVHKFGRTTSYTVGRIASIDTDVTIQYNAGPIFFPGQITIASVAGARTTSPFSKAGDSGSLIVERGTGHAVGLLFAGSDQRTIANHLGDVLRALGVQLA
jgi:hypothetical protein